MQTYAANRYQPQICFSLATEWLTHMMVDPPAGEVWCAGAALATLNSAFYVRHLMEQGELFGGELEQRLRILGRVQQNIFDEVNRFTPAQLVDEHRPLVELVGGLRQMAQEYRPLVDLLKNRTVNKIKMMRLRRIRVARGQGLPTLNDLHEEFLKLQDTARYYLIGVESANRLVAHVVAVVSTKKNAKPFNKGYIYYYDPNLRQVTRWRKRNQFNEFIRCLLVQWAAITYIWQVERI